MKKYLNTLVALGIAAGIILPEYSVKHLRWIVPPKGNVLQLCYDIDGDGKEDLAELRRYNGETHDLDKPFQIMWDKNQDGVYTIDEVYPVEKKTDEPVKESSV